MPAVKLKLFTTGGTIDGTDTRSEVRHGTSDAAKWLAAQPGIEFSAQPLFNKDSREITDAERSAIVKAVSSCEEELILISHGTYTIAETARVLKQALADTQKTVLLVGAWVPFGKTGSDAPAQMRFALSALYTGQIGVWIAMDGRLWDPDRTEKREIEPGKFCLVEKRKTDTSDSNEVLC